jgi:hypothetical protein
MARIRSEADAAFEGDRIFLDYVLRCGQNLANIVSGRTNPLETLFPGGDFTQAEDLYERAPLSAYFRAIGRSALEAFVRSRRRHRLDGFGIAAGSASERYRVPLYGCLRVFSELRQAKICSLPVRAVRPPEHRAR